MAHALAKLLQSQPGVTGHAFCRPHTSFIKGRAYNMQKRQWVMNIGKLSCTTSATAHESASTVAGDEDASGGGGSCEEEKMKEGCFTVPSAAVDSFKKRWLRRIFKKEIVSSEEIAALHEAKMKEFRGSSRDDFHNPLFEELWAPWARRVQYVDSRNPDFWFDDGGSNFKWKHLAKSFAIPTLRVLEYMVCKAPEGKIAEIGSGLGYWALLLKSLGANVVAVDNFAELGDTGKPMVETVRMDGPEFIKQGGADGRALFLCWPPMKPLPKNFDERSSNEDGNCFAEACLELYKGHTVFFVGESPGCTYDVAEWMENHSEMGWRLETEIEIPCWAGFHDSFMCFVKHEES